MLGRVRQGLGLLVLGAALALSSGLSGCNVDFNEQLRDGMKRHCEKNGLEYRYDPETNFSSCVGGPDSGGSDTGDAGMPPEVGGDSGNPGDTGENDTGVDAGGSDSGNGDSGTDGGSGTETDSGDPLDANCETAPVYFDGDKDGQGFGESLFETCVNEELRDGLSWNALDCDDDKEDIYLGAGERCDNIDWNCDGDPLEGYDIGGICNVGVGACSNEGRKICAEDGIGTICNVSPTQAEVEDCNGIDDDCDGFTDEEDDLDLIAPAQPCYVGVGECQGEGSEIKLCDDGEWGEEYFNCDAVALEAGVEACNGLDDDCDGEADNRCMILVTGDDGHTYLIGSTEVTQGQWERIMENNPSTFAECGDICPVETLNFWEALAYTNNLSTDEGFDPCYTFEGCDENEPGEGMVCSVNVLVLEDCLGYRLPTLPESVFAAMAGGDGDLYGPLNEIAWWAGNSEGTTHPVGEKVPNAWGLYDVVGNVSEWVDNLPSARGRIHGCSYSAPAEICNIGWSNEEGYGDRNDRQGFRIVRTVDDDEQFE